MLGASQEHICYLKSNTDKITDSTLKTFCTDKENCLRSTMISSLGCTVQQGTRLCCMVCNPSAFSDVDGGIEGRAILEVGKVPTRKKRRVAVRKVDGSLVDAIKAGLKEERAKYIAEHPTLAILGVDLVCPESVISSSVLYVYSDMDCFSLRQELKQPFFNVIMALV